MPMHRRTFSEPLNYNNWAEKHLLNEVNVRRLSYEYENAAYLAEILHVNDRKFNERWDELQHMNVQELREEAEAWNITVDSLAASEHGPLLAEIAASAARDAVTNHNSLKRAMQVIQDREAKAAGKSKSLSKASRLVREAAAKAAKAAKAEEEKQKASEAAIQASKKRKATQSQNRDSGYSTTDAKPSNSPSDFNDGDEEGPVDHAKKRITACDTNQDHDQKPAANEKKASKRKRLPKSSLRRHLRSKLNSTKSRPSKRPWYSLKFGGPDASRRIALDRNASLPLQRLRRLHHPHQCCQRGRSRMRLLWWIVV
ncbi:hypothetical protein FB567DRAFT_627902 [Paraphoma chrysanthemicola]|uniref:Uncharacterized protein n=1 Tax=Paraphoma chrysanthemicola TaxID=798071 RepID=A0A8K0R7X5_9PLEO|nr:hypothetical protein FB567DRAFT_627902 [Paraphoma chrysanthemicola]